MQRILPLVQLYLYYVLNFFFLYQQSFVKSISQTLHLINCTTEHDLEVLCRSLDQMSNPQWLLAVSVHVSKWNLFHSNTKKMPYICWFFQTSVDSYCFHCKYISILFFMSTVVRTDGPHPKCAHSLQENIIVLPLNQKIQLHFGTTQATLPCHTSLYRIFITQLCSGMRCLNLCNSWLQDVFYVKKCEGKNTRHV